MRAYVFTDILRSELARVIVEVRVQNPQGGPRSWRPREELQLESGGRIPSSPGDLKSFRSQSSTDWMRPTHVMVFTQPSTDVNVNLI